MAVFPEISCNYPSQNNKDSFEKKNQKRSDSVWRLYLKLSTLYIYRLHFFILLHYEKNQPSWNVEKIYVPNANNFLALDHRIIPDRFRIPGSFLADKINMRFIFETFSRPGERVLAEITSVFLPLILIIFDALSNDGMWLKSKRKNIIIAAPSRKKLRFRSRPFCAWLPNTHTQVHCRHICMHNNNRNAHTYACTCVYIDIW